MAAASITRLRCVNNPPAIFFAVMAIVVASVNAVADSGPMAHISKKRLERIAPFIAYADAPAAVMSKCCGFGVVAPLKHPGPCSVLRRFCHAVCEGGNISCLPHQAPTATSGSLSKTGQFYHHLISTGALTKPTRTPTNHAVDGNGDKSTKQLASYIKSAGHLFVPLPQIFVNCPAHQLSNTQASRLGQFLHGGNLLFG